jgi:hypothetical protein
MRKYIIAATVAITVFASSAFAASLQVNAGTLQAGQDTIGECVSDQVTVSYAAPGWVNGAWLVNEVTLDHGANCTDLAFSVIITGDNQMTTDSVTGTFTADPARVFFDPPFSAEDATDIHLVIRNASS